MNVAHIRTSDNTEQSVEEHCVNTADYAEIYGKKVNLEKSARLLGLLHDIGKLSSDFDKYIHGDACFVRGSIDHCFAGAKFLYRLAEDDISLQKTAKLLGRVILSHHGLHDWVTDECKDYYIYRIGKNERYDEILMNLRELSYYSDCMGLLKEADDEYKIIRCKLKNLVIDMRLKDGKHKNTALAFYYGMTERLLTSVLIDADRTDTTRFMSFTYLEHIINYKELWENMNLNMQKKLNSFSDKIDKISLQRKSISDRCAKFAENVIGCCKLIVPTGGGKTLSSLRFAIEYCRQHNKEKIIYVAPFLSILEQNSDEIRSITGDESFLEHHSDAAYKIVENDDADELRNYELHSDCWDSPVIATTMVQFLNTLFSDKTTSVRRMHNLCSAVIIIDEIQSLPLKCVYMFDLAMNFLSHICGSTIVLCSATQPPFEMLKEYPLLIDSKYPSMTGDVTKDFEIFRRTSIVSVLRQNGYTFEEAASMCIDEQKKYKNILFIVNTKLAAKKLYQLIKQKTDVDIIHLSTNMCPQHRRENISFVREKLKNDEPIICVTTQLIEAGVDISFGCVIRSIAGMDNAAQAAGRCNRNGEHNFICPVFLINLTEENLSGLAEITSARDISQMMIDAVPDDTDFLGVDFISKYFDKFYKENNDKLCFPIKKPKTNLMELLSLNYERSQMIRKQPDMSSQAFKTAGQAFSVIDDNTKGIIVPYNQYAQKIIAELNRPHNSAEINMLLKKAQPYMVNVYQNTLNDLEKESAIFGLMSGVIALDVRFYDKEYGLTYDQSANGAIFL